MFSQNQLIRSDYEPLHCTNVKLHKSISCYGKCNNKPMLSRLFGYSSPHLIKELYKFVIVFSKLYYAPDMPLNSFRKNWYDFCQHMTRWHILHQVEVEWVWNKKFLMSQVENFFRVYKPRSWNSPIETIINKLQDFRTFFHNLSFTLIIWC